MRDVDNDKGSVALLLAAHGERSEGADNDGIRWLAATLRERRVAREVGIGFIKGEPGIAESVSALRAERILVYPLFLSDGFFTRIRLPQLMAQACSGSGAAFEMLRPLGLEPALAALIAERIAATARRNGISPEEIAVVLLAHGSTGDAGSRQAAEETAEAVSQCVAFRALRVAFLEERPFLHEATANLASPIVVFGLFAGEGMHGAQDAPRLVRELRRQDVFFAGTVASLDGIAHLVAAAVEGASRSEVRIEDEPGLQAVPRDPASGRDTGAMPL